MAKNSNTLVFYSNLYLNFLRPCCENIFKIVCIVSEKIWKCISQFAILQLASTCSLFTISLKSKIYFQYRSEITWPTISWLPGMASICSIRKGRYKGFLHEGLLFDWLIFLLYLLQSVCCSKYSAKATNFSFLNLFLYFLHPFVLKYLRIFVTAMRTNFTAF